MKKEGVPARMDLRLIWHHVGRWIPWVLIPTVLIGIGAYELTSAQPKTYQASTTLFVQVPTNPSEGLSSAVDTAASTVTATTYSQMITNPVVLQLAEDYLRRKPTHVMSASKWVSVGPYANYSFKTHTVTASQPSTTAGTLLFTVTVNDTRPKRAAAAADAVGSAFINKIRTIENNILGVTQIQSKVTALHSKIVGVEKKMALAKGEKTKAASQQVVLLEAHLKSLTAQYSRERAALAKALAPVKNLAGVSTYAQAVVPTAPSGPHPARSALIAAALALLLCMGGIFAYEYLDDAIRSAEDAEQLLEAPLLGTIEKLDTKSEPSSVVLTRPRAHVADAYRLVRTNLQFTNVDTPPRVLLVTSTWPKEGKSTTAANLARVFAQGGTSVTLVDCDLRRPTLHRVFKVDGRQGLTNLLVAGDTDTSGCSDLEQSNLSVVSSGPLPPNPADLIASQKMRDLLGKFREEEATVILDSPPILAAPDATILSTMVDGVLFVVNPSVTKRRDLLTAREAIDAVGGKIVGVVMNGISHRDDVYYSHYVQYGYESSPDHPTQPGTSRPIFASDVALDSGSTAVES